MMRVCKWDGRLRHLAEVGLPHSSDEWLPYNLEQIKAGNVQSLPERKHDPHERRTFMETQAKCNKWLHKEPDA